MLLSVKKTSHAIPYEDFERSSVGGFFEVRGFHSDIDVIFPPAKITDLHTVGRVTATSVQVEWTAVGESLDEGTGENVLCNLCNMY